MINNSYVVILHGEQETQHENGDFPKIFNASTFKHETPRNKAC